MEVESGSGGSEVRTPPRVAVCVVTYRRPEGLARLLGALDAQALPEPAPDVRVVVVDNDPDESARAVCRDVALRLGLALTYATEKRRGIPQARNAALALVLGDADLVAFVDDDCEPGPDWLAQLLRALSAHGADAATGPHRPRFERTPPPWIEQGRFFESPRRPDGARLATAYTHNALVRVGALTALGALFEERLALAGGSDAELFRRLARAGHRIVWAEAAVVVEHVPASRATLAWIVRRAFRVGTSTAFVDRLHDGAWRAVPRALLHGAWCLAKGGGGLVTAAVRGRAAAVHALRLAVYGAGRIAGAFGVLTREYAVTHGR